MIQAINEMWFTWGMGGGGGSSFCTFWKKQTGISLLMLNFDIMCMKPCLNVAIFFQEKKKNTKTKQKKKNNLSLSILNGRLLF